MILASAGLSLWTGLTVCLLVSLICADRNRAAVGAGLILLVVWRVALAFAQAAREIQTSWSQTAEGGAVRAVAEWILDVSPITQLVRTADNSAALSVGRCATFMVVMNLIFSLLLLTPKARKRFDVEYH